MIPTRQPIRQPVYNNYTGQGFKGERLLATAGLLLTVISTLLLIDLTIKQRKQTMLEVEERKKKNGTLKA